MTSDLDIYRTAKALIDQHGDMGAEMHAAMRADELLEPATWTGGGYGTGCWKQYRN